MTRRFKESGLRLSVLLGAIVVCLSTTSHADDYSQWPYSCTITINTSSTGANVMGNVVNFPVRVRLTPATFSRFINTLPGGADIRFAKSNGTHLAYQIERWVDGSNNSDTADIWVRIDTVYGNNATQSIRMLWGKSNVADSSKPYNVFQTSNGFVAVYHLGEAGTGTRYNSAQNQFNGATVAYDNDEKRMCAIGFGDDLETDDGINCGDITINNALTLSAWLRPSSFTMYGKIICKQWWSDVSPWQAYALQIDYGTPAKVSFGCAIAGVQQTVVTGNTIAQYEWSYIAAAYNGTLRMYLNGSQDGSTIDAAGGISTTNRATTIGYNEDLASQRYNGNIDEVRIENVARSADWIKLCYQNQRAGQTITSVVVTQGAPAITVQPQSLAKAVGQQATFTVVATGTPTPAYQWRRNGTDIPGAAGASFTIASVTAADSGAYSVVVANALGKLTSQNAVLSILARAGFTVSASSGKIPLSVTFTDASSGVISKRYWYFGDNSGKDSSASPVHSYTTENSFNVKLVVFDAAGKRCDSMTTVIRTYKDNPVLISGRMVLPGKVEITYTNYGLLPTGPLPTFADSIALWYKPGSIPLSGTGATYAANYQPAQMQSQGKGAPVKDTLSVPGPYSDSVYGFITAVHWTDGTWSKFTTGNGCLVLVKDTSSPLNVCGISGRYIGTDSAAIVLSNMTSIDTSVVDSFCVWYGTSAGDSVPNFNSPLAQWYNLKERYGVITAAGRDSMVVKNAQFNAGVVKLVWCGVTVKGKNDKCSRTVKTSFTVGVDRPANPVVLRAAAQSASRILLSWPAAVTGIEGIRIVYRADAAVPVDNFYFDSAEYFSANPSVTDTLFAVAGLQENTHYYFGAQIYKGGLWSVVTQNSSAHAVTPEAIAALDANRIKLDSCTFDPVSNLIKVTWKVAALAQDSLQVGISYSTEGYPSAEALAQQVAPVLGSNDTTVALKLREALLFNTTYYVALWERKEGGKWTAPTDSSQGMATSGNYTWQTVTYFTKLGGDTACAFNGNIRIMTDSVFDIDGVIRTTEKLLYWEPDPSSLAGFIPASIAFRFNAPQPSARIYVGLRYANLPVTYSTGDLRVYRFQNGVWSPESSVVADEQDGYVSVKTNSLGTAFMVLLDTQSVSVRRSPYSMQVTEYTDQYDTFTISDNSGNVKWQFMCAKGADAYSAGGSILAGSIGTVRSGRVIVHTPYSYVDRDNGVRAVFTVNDGVHVVKTDVSRQVIRLNSDHVRTEPMKWVPLRVTAALDSPQVRYALRDRDNEAVPWTYDTRKVRLFKWYPSAQNASSPQKWVEYSDAMAEAFAFRSGGLLWIKTREETEVNFGPGVTLPLSAPQSIVMAANSWTDMALPFKFNIKVGDIIDSTLVGTLNADSLLIYSWENDSITGVYRTQPVYIAGLSAANLANKSSTLRCLDMTGYSIYNPMASEQITLRIPPIPEAMSRYGQGLPKKSQAGWAIKIRSSLFGGSRLTDVYCVYDPAKGGAMRYFPLAPTFEKVYVGLYDARMQKVYGHAVTGATADGGCAYKIAFVNESQSGQRFVYSLEHSGAAAGALRARLYNEATGRYEDAQSSISVAANSTQYRWLYAGNEGYLAKAPVLVASTLELVGAYPNPFRSSLRIRYSLPATGIGAVRFTICDLRGSVVWRQSVGGRDHGGAGELLWNATTHAGSPVAAGIYVLCMTAFDERQQRAGVFERKITLLP